MTLKGTSLLLVLVLLLSACGGGGGESSIPKTSYSSGGLTGFVTVPAGCTEPCNSVYSEFQISDDLAKLPGLACTTNFNDPADPTVQPMAQATHTYAQGGKYDVVHECIQKTGDVEWSTSVTIHIKVPMQVAPVLEETTTGDK